MCHSAVLHPVSTSTCQDCKLLQVLQVLYLPWPASNPTTTISSIPNIQYPPWAKLLPGVNYSHASNITPFHNDGDHFSQSDRLIDPAPSDSRVLMLQFDTFWIDACSVLQPYNVLLSEYHVAAQLARKRNVSQYAPPRRRIPDPFPQYLSVSQSECHCDATAVRCHSLSRLNKVTLFKSAVRHGIASSIQPRIRHMPHHTR